MTISNQCVEKNVFQVVINKFILKKKFTTFNKMFEINFNSYDHNFCESSIYSIGQHPEYLNAISSLFITFIGLNGLRKPHLSYILSSVYSCLIVNGILSYNYHYYNSIGFGLLDRMSMVLLGLNTTFMFVNSLKQLTIISTRMTKMINVSVITYYSILLTVAGLHMEIVFNIMFGLFLFSLIFFMYIINIHAKEHYIQERILSIGWKGVQYIVFSAIFWIATEILCYKISFIKYLFGHVWWHVFVSYGGYNISLVPHYIQMLTDLDDEIININKDMFGIHYLEFYSNV